VIRVMLESIMRMRRAKSVSSCVNWVWELERVPGGGNPVGWGFQCPPLGHGSWHDLTRRTQVERLRGFRLAGVLHRSWVPVVHPGVMRAGISGGIWWRHRSGDPRCG